jgi:hypothetical protein
LFQGYFLCRPELVHGKRIPARKMQVMQLLARLHNANISTGKLEDIIGCDPVLSYKTLKLINSAYHRTAARIESLGRAITYLGTDQIRALASLLALATLSDKPLALKSQTLMRTRTCELLGTRIPGAARTTFFSAGLLSTLDAYFDQPLDVTLRPCHCTRTCGVRSWLTRACRAAFCTPLFARSKLTGRVSTDPSSSDTASPMPALTARIRMRSQCVRRASRSRQPDCPTPPDDHLAAACGPRFRSATNWTHSPTATAERFGIISPDS